jgi:hypothetical protein
MRVVCFSRVKSRECHSCHYYPCFRSVHAFSVQHCLKLDRWACIKHPLQPGFLQQVEPQRTVIANDLEQPSDIAGVTAATTRSDFHEWPETNFTRGEHALLGYSSPTSHATLWSVLVALPCSTCGLLSYNLLPGRCASRSVPLHISLTVLLFIFVSHDAKYRQC